MLITATVMFGLTAKAQLWLYVCHHDSCEVYDTAYMDSITIQGKSFRIDRMPPYSAQQVDSMLLYSPADFIVEERGWWGDMYGGESRFLTVLTIEIGYEDLYFDYHVRFSFTAHDSICQTAKCELLFDEEWQMNLFFSLRLETTGGTTGGPPGGGDPYIYVKETLTGPRRYEIWTMGDPVLPLDCIWEDDHYRLTLGSDCSSILAGRPMDEVRQIVETWLFQPTVMKEETNLYEDN